ncbi:MAG TPA: GWxTD domain-containing protein [Thermoanaerobaculia bacterium]|nr:GWxTD domain-containing protein [Thermoanaerobaculia bacterium]
MKLFRVLSCSSVLLLASAAVAADLTLPELFKRAKDEFAAGSYQRSLTDFNLLDSTSAKPGFEADRAKLLPVVTFYRGANLAALGRKDDAKEAFVTYLAFVPTAAIASPPFPRATVDLFEAARKEAGKRSNTISTAYATFLTPPGWTLAPDEKWIETPVRYLLTPAQKKEYAMMTTNAERAAFIEAFWKQLDPTPETEENEFRRELERRIAFADVTWTADKLPGRLSDRAAIFAFLGTPTYAAQANIGASDDTMAALRTGGNQNLAGYSGTSRLSPSTALPLPARSDNTDKLEQDYNRGSLESWIYRNDRLPKGIIFQEVRVSFVTKQGYGTGVLQKDPQPMQALGFAAEAARRDKQLN